MPTLRIILVVLALTPSLLALDVRTLDGKSYENCTVSLVEPDALCLLFPGGGARVKFTNLPENLRVTYDYDPVKAAAFEQAQASKKQREDARWQVARIQAEARRTVAASNAVVRAHAAAATSPGSREAAAYGGRNQGQGGYGGNGQISNSGTRAEYVGVSLASAGNTFSGQGGGGGGYGGAGGGGRNQGGGTGGTGAIYYGVRLAP